MIGIDLSVNSNFIILFIKFCDCWRFLRTVSTIILQKLNFNDNLLNTIFENILEKKVLPKVKFSGGYQLGTVFLADVIRSCRIDARFSPFFQTRGPRKLRLETSNEIVKSYRHKGTIISSYSYRGEHLCPANSSKSRC